MDLSAVSEIHDHTDYVKWCDEGSPADNWDNNGEWTEERLRYYDEEGEEGVRQQLAAITAAAAHLDARRGKGKGKNKKGNGKGKGKKGKGSGLKGTSPAVGAQTPTPGGTRQCYNCNEWSHISKDCKNKYRRELKPLERGHGGDTLSQAGSARSPAAWRIQLYVMKSRRSAASKAADNDRLYNSVGSCCIASVENPSVHALPSPAVG